MERFKYFEKLLKNRQHKNCAEVGVWTGLTTFYLLNNLSKIKKYYCIDLWEYYEDYTKILRSDSKYAVASMDKIYNDFLEKAKKFGDKISVYRMTSVEASKLIPDDSLDFIFIDANHAYEYVKEDLDLWYPKVKNGGIISGHDYKNKDDIFGVTKAVHEKFDKVNVGPNWVWWKEK
jgi:predicted O-methyltransferase YrrM